MNESVLKGMVEKAERRPDLVQVYLPTIEAAILYLMSNTRHIADENRRARFAAYEMRLRLIRDRWRVRCGDN